MSAITIGGDLIHYEKLGRGRPVLLIHGWVGSWRYWIPLMQKLHLKFSVYTLDLIGFGDSAKDPANYTVDAQVQMLEQFMDTLGISKAAMIGHGLGGLVTIRFARNNPDKVARMMLSSLPLFDPGNLSSRTPGGTRVKLTGNDTRHSLSPNYDQVVSEYENTIPSADNNRTIPSGSNSLPDKTIASTGNSGGSGSGYLANDVPTIRNPQSDAIDRDALRRAAEERNRIDREVLRQAMLERDNATKQNHLLDAFKNTTMLNLLEKSFRQSEPEYGKLKADVEKSDDKVLENSSIDFEVGAFYDEIRALTAPVLAIHGEEDPIFKDIKDPKKREAIWDYLTLQKEDVFVPIVLPNVRHFPMLEHDAFPRLTTDFLTVGDISKLELRERWRRRNR